MTMYPCPDQVIHYTSQSALTSILDNESLWLTNIRGMKNDPTEFDYFMQLAGEVVAELALVSRGNWNVRFLAELRTLLSIRRPEEIYCICFTSVNDNDRAWSEYADNGSGVAISFDLKTILQSNEWGAYYCFPDFVVYSRVLQKNNARKVTEVERRSILNGIEPHIAAKRAYGWLVWEAMFSKSSDFESEHEFRIIVQIGATNPTVDPTRIRQGINRLELPHSISNQSNHGVNRIGIKCPRTAVKQLQIGARCPAVSELRSFVSSHCGNIPIVTSDLE